MSARESRGSRTNRAGARNVVKVRVALPRINSGTLARSEEAREGLRRSSRTLPGAQKLRDGKPNEIGVGVIGLGFMGRTHIHAYAAAREAGYGCRLVAVCDRNAYRLGGKVDIRGNIHKGSGGLRLFVPVRRPWPLHVFERRRRFRSQDVSLL